MVVELGEQLPGYSVPRGRPVQREDAYAATMRCRDVCHADGWGLRGRICAALCGAEEEEPWAGTEEGHCVVITWGQRAGDDGMLAI